MPAAALSTRYAAVRRQSLQLAAPLSAEDAQAQSMPDASPTKWHLAHVTWFFETLVLEPHEAGFVPYDPAFRVLFNSYYQGVGAMHPRPQRGLLTRPTLQRVLAWREAVDRRVQALLARPDLPAAARALVELGIQHEQQHQELMLTDALHLLSCNPLRPAYREQPAPAPAEAAPLRWIGHDGGLVEIGHDGAGFAFDNETPRHRRWLAPFELAQRLVTNAEWLAFVDDGGYREPRWWLSAGWDWLRAQGIEAPLYWQHDGARWWRYGLQGLQPLLPQEPVLHLSFYEADAYARWAAAQQPAAPPTRLPTEAEWEHAAAALSPAGANLLEHDALRPQAAAPREGLQQIYGDAWEWTRSAYEPYPGYRPWAGAVGEYNGKFMLDQLVLRGGSFATPASHIRASYRNFFPAPTRWQFAGLRLARDRVG